MHRTDLQSSVIFPWRRSYPGSRSAYAFQPPKLALVLSHPILPAIMADLLPEFVVVRRGDFGLKQVQCVREKQPDSRKQDANNAQPERAPKEIDKTCDQVH